MGVIEKFGLCNGGKWVFKITGGSSSFIEYITKDANFEVVEEEEEENPFLIDSPAVFSGSDGFESPPPSPPLPSFRFTPHPSDLVLYSGDLLEAMGDSSLHRFSLPFAGSNLPF
uniref:Uncharacterized protein n=1 Tax=Fagus sylvatica TaxID=28930 RepID=A0A2N9HVT7_FAGSY